MQQKGQFDTITESVTRDRIGFINASIRRMYLSSEMLNELPGPPQASVYGAIWTRTVVEAADGASTVRWLYEGLGDGAPQVYVYEWQGNFETVPIQAHPDYRSWLGVYGTEDSQGNWKPFRDLDTKSTSGLKPPAGSSSSNPLLGADSFLSMGGTWIRRYATRTVPSGAMNGVGLISGSPPGCQITVPSGRNWLKGPPQMTFRGNAWDVSEQWILSGRGGWVPMLYSGSSGSGAADMGGGALAEQRVADGSSASMSSAPGWGISGGVVGGAGLGGGAVV
jgi:hypothetical protein